MNNISELNKYIITRRGAVEVIKGILLNGPGVGEALVSKEKLS